MATFVGCMRGVGDLAALPVDSWWITDWLIDRLVAGTAGLFVHWQIGCLSQPTDLFAFCAADWFIGWLPIWLVDDWLTFCSTDSLCILLIAYLTNSSTDRLFSSFIDCSIACWTDCSNVCLFKQIIHCLIHQLLVQLTGWLINWTYLRIIHRLDSLDGCLSNQLIDHRLDVHLTYWLIYRLAICSCDWLTDLLDFCSNDWLLSTETKESADMLP